ncbi:cupin domain-containing protein [Botryobacter ruber]|uniref:cupin domain-containing protein n=1 Tax=Botryobacter ruber TaxID=2171629 RepID=UPI0013E3947B|nr:cupin domain-containing protein [Botryobacter ruber]
MVRKGDILYDPVRRATVTFLLTAADTAGMLLQLDIIISPGGTLYHLPMHVHPKQQETVYIKSGKIWATIDGLKRLYGPGEEIRIPAGVPHQLENASWQEELNVRCEMVPALATETLYETVLAFAQSEWQEGEEHVSLLQLAITLNKYANQYYLAAYPVWAQKILFKLLAPVALLTGYEAEADYKKTVSGKKSISLLYG